MIVRGNVLSKDNYTKLDILERYGIVKATKCNGTFCFTPLGKKIKDRIVEFFKNELYNLHYDEIELPIFLKISNNDSFVRNNSKVFSTNNQVFSCDALGDCIEASSYIGDNSGVFWEKKYIDTSIRVAPTLLRFHSYELICIISKKTIRELCDAIMILFSQIFLEKKSRLYIKNNGNDDFSIRINIGDDDFTIAHVHGMSGYEFSVCGIPIEKLIFAIIRYNMITPEFPIILLDNVLIIYKNQEVINEDKYDFVDARNCKIFEKIGLLKGLGVRSISLLDNYGVIKKCK